MNAPGEAPRMDSKALARARRDALRAHTRRIRQVVAGATVTLFALVFLIVFVQLASGHDPALVAAQRRRAAVTSHTSSASEGSSASEDSTGDESSSGASSEDRSEPSGVVTSQS